MSFRKSAAVLITAAVGLCALGTGPAVGSTLVAAGSTPATVALTAAVQAPEGWTVTASQGGYHLVWTTDRAVIGDAQVQFFAGDRPLGIPRIATDGRSFRLDVPAGLLTDPGDLQVRAGGRRLDAAGVLTPGSSRTVVPSTAENAAALPPVKVDPGTPGTFTTVTGSYTLPSVKLPDFPEPVEMQAVVVAPKGATGRRPLALFLHGRHEICYGPGADVANWPCPAGTKPVPSYRGYLRAQRLLASQGYVTVSISANGINGQDFAASDGGAQARSSLIRLHLAHWADWAGESRADAPAIVRVAPVADLSQVLLMGHSRGGDGVNRAAIDSLTPPPSAIDGYHGPVRWTIRGTLLLAPTLFGHNPAADVPSVVVLPGCDGDVYDLQGEYSVDGTRQAGTGTALHSAAFVIGANHNFFNSEWTPKLAAAPASDDWFDPKDKVCGKGKKSLRLKPVQQQKVGATYIAAAARLFIKGDDRVLPLLDGSGVRAPSVQPARVLSHAVGAARQPFVLPTADLKVTGAGATKARLCREVTRRKSACSRDISTPIPHFVSYSGVPEEPERYAVALKWAKAGGSGAKLQPQKPVSLAGSTSLALRVIVPTNGPAKQFDVLVTDASGHKATLGGISVKGLPGTQTTVSTWGQEVRVSLKAARRAKLDLNRIKRLQLIPRSRSGHAWLLDAWGWHSGTPAVRVAQTSRVDVGSPGEVPETDAPATHQIPISVSGNVPGKIRIFVVDWSTFATTTRLITLPPGVGSVNVPIRVSGDDTYGYGGQYSVLAEAINGTVVGAYEGDLKVVEDEPAPVITVTPIADQVTEGKTLKWRLNLSAAAGVNLLLPLIFLPPTGAELSTTDLPAAWVRSNLNIEPRPSRVLSRTDSMILLDIPAGTRQVDVVTPTVKDAATEGAEQVRYRILPFDWLFEVNPTVPPDGPELVGTVTDAS